MLKLLKKEKNSRVKQEPPVDKSDVGGKKCGACGHVRHEKDMAPEWQCPSCQSAYNKVDKGYVALKSKSKAKRRKLRAKVAETKGEIQNKMEYSTMGIFAGMATILKGTGTVCKSCMKACVPSAGSPLLMVIGGAVLVAAIGYLLWNYLKLH